MADPLDEASLDGLVDVGPRGSVCQPDGIFDGIFERIELRIQNEAASIGVMEKGLERDLSEVDDDLYDGGSDEADVLDGILVEPFGEEKTTEFGDGLEFAKVHEVNEGESVLFLQKPSLDDGFLTRKNGAQFRRVFGLGRSLWQRRRSGFE